MDGQGTKRHRNIADNFNRLNIGCTNVIDDRETDRRTDDDIANTFAKKCTFIIFTTKCVICSPNLIIYGKNIASIMSYAMTVSYIG